MQNQKLGSQSDSTVSSTALASPFLDRLQSGSIQAAHGVPLPAPSSQQQSARMDF